MRVYIAADHAGFEFQKTIVEHLEKPPTRRTTWRRQFLAHPLNHA